MNAPWEREAARALRLAHAVLHPAPALPWAAPARALAADPAARFDAVLAGLLQLPDAPPSPPPAEHVLPRAASPFASAPERRDGEWGFPPSAGPSAVHAADPAAPPSPLSRVPVSRLFAEDGARSAPSADDPRPMGSDPPSAPGGFAAPRLDTPWTGREGWASVPPPSSSSASPPSAHAGTWRAVDGWTPAPPPSPDAFPSFAWEDARTGDAAPAAWDADPPRGALPDADRRMDGDPAAFPGVRVARSTADLRALLQAHVASPDLDAPPAFPPFDPAPPPERLAEHRPAEPAFPAPRPDTAADHFPPGAGGVPAVAQPDAGGAAYFPAFPGAETGPSALAEELLLERLMDRMEARAREDSIRRFGLTGGF